MPRVLVRYLLFEVETLATLRTSVRFHFAVDVDVTHNLRSDRSCKIRIEIRMYIIGVVVVTKIFNKC